MQQKSYSAATTVQKALKILESLGERQSLRPSEIAQQLGLSRSNVHRLLFTLEETGYVERSLDSTYYLGFKVFMLGSNFSTPNDITEIAYPHMKQLADISQENVNLGVMYENRVLYLNKIKSPHNLKLDTPIGKMDPLHCTGLGKALLSGFTDKELKEYITSTELTKYTPKTIIEPDMLFDHIRKVRTKGVAFDFEELDKGVHCIAASIYNHMNQTVAAISISAPSVRLTNKIIRKFKPSLLESCMAVSERLGYGAVKNNDDMSSRYLSKGR
jgi:IclR family KDG regulon transcriptional repressor